MDRHSLLTCGVSMVSYFLFLFLFFLFYFYLLLVCECTGRRVRSSRLSLNSSSPIWPDRLFSNSQKSYPHSLPGLEMNTVESDFLGGCSGTQVHMLA